MSKQLLEIQPKELAFIFELKKKSSCLVQLTNNTNQYVAFKVKTTSPKKYSVKPNVGILMPKSTSEFIVNMQAPLVVPEVMVCKDKFQILSTIVPVGTNCQDITSSMFDEEREYVERHKLRVILISPPNSLELSPIHGASQNGLAYKDSIGREQILSRIENLVPQSMVTKNVDDHEMVIEELKQEKDMELETETEKDVGLKSMKDEETLQTNNDAEVNIDNNTEDFKLIRDIEDMELKREKEEFRLIRDIEGVELKTEKDRGLKTMTDEENLQTDNDAELKIGNNTEEVKLIRDIEEMKTKLDELESKLNEAEVTMSKLTEEGRLSNQRDENFKRDTIRFE
ncbi:vesicle-associated protein 2-2 [Quillaja saponaria]|uniref:Vesicle-associated protein 2-2 n=1 Tax=Quillaja saponaria TaxID=32244 RepID=A0AAD7Q208_QUISA|nr:vesicle-associated protein 2-2 [Quillaja saponaria]